MPCRALGQRALWPCCIPLHLDPSSIHGSHSVFSRLKMVGFPRFARVATNASLLLKTLFASSRFDQSVLYTESFVCQNVLSLGMTEKPFKKAPRNIAFQEPVPFLAEHCSVLDASSIFRRTNQLNNSLCSSCSIRSSLLRKEYNQLKQKRSKQTFRRKRATGSTTQALKSGDSSFKTRSTVMRTLSKDARKRSSVGLFHPPPNERGAKCVFTYRFRARPFFLVCGSQGRIRSKGSNKKRE